MRVGATRRGEGQVLPADENTNFISARLRLQDATKITSMPLAFNTPTVPLFSTPSVMMGNPVRGIVSAVVSLPFFRYPLFGSSGTCWLNQSDVGEKSSENHELATCRAREYQTHFFLDVHEHRPPLSLLANI